MPQSVFGGGYLFGIPAGANPTPQVFGAVQDVNVDFGFDFKQLWGSSQFPLEQARAKGKIDIKAGMGRYDPGLFNQLFFGSTLTTGEKLSAIGETAAIPSTPFTVTVANAATFSTDLGVFNVNLGRFMARVASAPATGQYSVNTTTGVYTFAAADTGHAVKFYYTYGSASTGSTVTYTNQLMGSSPVFGLALVNSFRGKSLYLTFPAVQSSKLSLPMKQDDFSLPSLDMSAQDDGSGNIFTYSMTG